MFKDQVYTAMVVKSLPNGRRMAYTLVVVIWVSLFLPQELGFEEVQSVLLLDRFSTVQGVLAYYSEAAKGKAKKITNSFSSGSNKFKAKIIQLIFRCILLLMLFLSSAAAGSTDSSVVQPG